MSIDNLGQEIASEMLDALMCDTGPITNDISRDSKIGFIVDRVPLANEDTLYDVGNILVKHNLMAEMHECNEGTVINLSGLDDNIINEIYDLLIVAPI